MRGPFRPSSQREVTPQHRGRFPGFDVLDEVHRWDDITAGVVLARLAPTTDLSFFTLAENGTATALLDLLLHQDSEPKVPVVALIDARLAAGETDGWHYDDLPEEGQAWRDTLVALDADAMPLHGTGFATIAPHQQAALIQTVQSLADDGGRWNGLPAKQVWSLWTRYACTAFYSHPWAWNEIGFSGPAYPRGYLHLGTDALERWETADSVDTDPVAFADRIEVAERRHRASFQDGT